MKVMLKKVALAAMIVSLAGCASNTQKQNTTIGALSGGVIGGWQGVRSVPVRVKPLPLVSAFWWVRWQVVMWVTQLITLIISML